MSKKFIELTEIEKLKMMFEYIEKIGCANSVEQSLAYIEDFGRDIIGMEKCIIWSIDYEKNIIYTQMKRRLEIVELDIANSLLGKCVKLKVGLATGNPDKENKFTKSIDKMIKVETKELIAEPIINRKGEVIGIIEGINKIVSDDGFTKEDIVLLKVISAYCANNLETLLLSEELKQTQKEIIILLTELCEKRSLETGSHVKRVSEFARLVGMQIGLNEEKLEILTQASALHDIGKLSTPDMILQKRGSLTEDEFEIMKRHSEEGYKMLMRSNKQLLKEGAKIAYQHHEKYNGKGYPKGLKKDEIDINAKIVALCDVFDALTSKRVYKAIWPIEEAISLIEREKGEHFDPVVVDAFMEVLPKIKETMEKYRD